MNIWFDMDGTIANFYGVENWLTMLESEETTPYEQAMPMLNMNTLARQLNTLARKGHTIGIISWTSKNSTEDFHNRIVEAKQKWLATHLHSVKWNRIEIVPYNTPKWQVCHNGILFDDEERNRNDWDIHAGMSFKPENITEVLSVLNKILT